MMESEEPTLSVQERVVKLEAESQGTGMEFPVVGSVDTPRLEEVQERQGSRGGRASRISLTKFDGTKKWSDFLNQFRRASKVNRWSEEDQVELLCLHLEGTALEFVNELPVSRVQRFESLVDALEGRFGTERMATIFKCELKQRKRRKGESLPDLGQDLRRLFRLAYPKSTLVEQEERLIEHFLEALGDRQCRLEVRRGRPTSLEEAIHLAMDAEAWELEEEETGKRARASRMDTSEPSLALLMNLTKLVEGLTDSVKSLDAQKAPKKDTMKCYLCGEAGHFKRQCPKGSGNANQSQ